MILTATFTGTLSYMCKTASHRRLMHLSRVALAGPVFRQCVSPRELPHIITIGLQLQFRNHLSVNFRS